MSKAIFTGHTFAFICIGIWNTVSGYLLAVTLFPYLRLSADTLLSLIVLNLILITYSYINYRVFLYRSLDNLFKAYVRFVYISAGVTLFGLVTTWTMIELFLQPFWFSQGIVTILAALLSFLGHVKHTFRNL